MERRGLFFCFLSISEWGARPLPLSRGTTVPAWPSGGQQRPKPNEEGHLTGVPLGLSLYKQGPNLLCPKP